MKVINKTYSVNLCLGGVTLKFLYSCLIMLLSVSTMSTQILASTGKSLDSGADVIRASDKLNIQVFREKELTGIFTTNSVGFVVDASGNIDYPLLGKINVEGKSIQELQMYITDKLKIDYLNDPQVQVSFYERGANNTVAIMGQVSKPGNYKHTAETTIARAISEAGGFMQIRDYIKGQSLRTVADASDVRITRRTISGEEVSTIVDVQAILEGRRPDEKLEPGDLVFVPEKKFDRTVSILGQVNQPGNYELVPGMTVIRLVSEAQGMTRLAAPSKIVLTRMNNGGTTQAKQIDLQGMIHGKVQDIALEPGDTIFVPEITF